MGEGETVSYTHLDVYKRQDGQQWWAAFTSFEEELKGSGNVMSTFLSDMEMLFTTAVRTEGISGVIINPWNRTLMLDKNLIQIVLGNQTS